MFHLPGHEGLTDTGLPQDLDTLTQVPEGHPVEVRPGVAGRGLEFGKRLLLHGDDRDVVTEVARPLEREEGKPAVAGDQTNTGYTFGALKDASEKAVECQLRPAASCHF